ncbi:MAG: chromosome segregation protein SMC, partial [Acidimicrobiales bacterium]|nr:chromosome segregation protein SMC [Acidimicrobiales bacterium]
MFLKSLTLKGFKSFADATVLELEPGITVVVGPNGSGKSNVVDSIGWVLGAQAPSVVRSKSMDDVIFAGTSKRPALGRAEVALTIDNTAGLLPIDFTEVTISRTLFRTGDSEYAINGVPCRLLDIQELLSDTGVGRQQHVIVSQGQIDAVLNARPEDRRLIIEEAAGVLKYRRRKEKSERRLAATEGNLTRLSDLLREVRRSLRPLERQADAARRHGAVVAELGALRVYMAGRELTTLRNRLATGEARKADLGQQVATLKGELVELDTAVLAAEAQLSAAGGDDLGDALARFESLRERARGLAAVLAERRRGVERDRSAFVDQAVIFSLEADAARLRDELAEVEAEAAGLVPDWADLSTVEAELAEARSSFEQQWGDGVVATGGGEAAEARGELAARRGGLERDQAELERARHRLESLEQRATRLADDLARFVAAVADATSAAPERHRARDVAAEAHAAAEAELAAAEEARRSAEKDHHSWEARAEALAVALDEARARAGADHLAGVDGVLGTLLDLVDVDEGWQAAFEAAAGSAVTAVVVDDAGAARRALQSLHAGDLAGAVVPLLDSWAPATPPPLGEPVRRHVRAGRPGVEALLDALIGGVVAVADWPAAVDAAIAHPDAVVVTRDGDRFGPSGWRVGTAQTGATGAALDEARERATTAAEEAARAGARAEDARVALDEARQVADAARREADDNDAVLASADDTRARVDADLADARREIESLQGHVDELVARVERDRARVAELEARLPDLERVDEEHAERGRALAEARGSIEEKAAAIGALRTDLEVRAAGLDERRQFLRRRLDELEARLARDAAERDAAEAKRVALDRRQVALDRLTAFVAERTTVVEEGLADLRERRRKQSEAARAVASRLDTLRRERADAERRLQEARELLQRAELDEAETRLRLETHVETLRRDLDCEPERAMAAELPELPEGTTPAARARDLERDLRLMGPINPLALEEYEALQERHEFLQAQLDDVKATRRDLGKVIRAIDNEIMSVFAAAYADVSANFESLFE